MRITIAPRGSEYFPTSLPEVAATLNSCTNARKGFTPSDNQRWRSWGEINGALTNTTTGYCQARTNIRQECPFRSQMVSGHAARIFQSERRIPLTHEGSFQPQPSPTHFSLPLLPRHTHGTIGRAVLLGLTCTRRGGLDEVLRRNEPLGVSLSCIWHHILRLQLRYRRRWRRWNFNLSRRYDRARRIPR